MFENRKILFVEDDAKEVANISSLLAACGADFVHKATVSDTLIELARASYDYLLSDLHLQTRAGVETPDGLQVIAAAIEQQPNISIVATSSDPRTDIVNQAIAAGAHHFIRKPLSKADELEIAFKLADERRLLTRDAEKRSRRRKPLGSWKKYSARYPYGIVMGEREEKIAKLVARKKASCIITGETGTGKEEAAKLIHRLRCEEEGNIPFVAVNCATITGSLAESLLFGHKKGAFTGADETVTGYISEADRGILFLDEIQTLSIPTQQKLLRVLNDGTYNRLGEAKAHKSNFQLIVASTKDLSQEVAEGRFLLDIQMRMLGLDFTIPPLRKRPQDLPILVALYLSRKNIELDDSEVTALIGRLEKFNWPGNIRQLFKSLEAWMLTCELDDLPLTAQNFPTFRDLSPSATSKSAVPASGIDYNACVDQDINLDDVLYRYERLILTNALQRHKSIGEAARALGMPRSTLDAKRRKFGLESRREHETLLD